MATEKIALEIEVKGAGSVKELKQSIKDARNELLQFEVGSEGFSRAQKKVSELTDKMSELGDSARIQGTGVERLGASFGLLGQAFSNGDLDKGKLALTGIGQAMKAIPIFLLLEGINFLIQNFDKLIEFIPGLQGIVDLFNDLTDAIGLTNHAQNKYFDDQITKSKQATEAITAYYDKEIALLKASGQETFLIEQAKREEYAKSLQMETAALAQKIIANGKATDEQTKQLNDLDKEYKRVILEQETAEIEYGIRIQKERDDRYNDQKKKNEESLKLTLKRLEEEEKLFYNKQGAELAREAEAAAQLEKQRLEAENAYLAKQADLDKQYQSLAKEQRDADTQAEIDRNKKLVEDKKKSEAAKVQAATVGLNAAQGLSQAFFASQLNQSKGNAAAELKIRKQMFEVDKAFNVARAVQDGIRSVQAALTIPPPGGQLLAIANGTLAAANIAKIVATQFDGSGTASADAGSTPNVSLPSSPPSIPQFGESGSRTLEGGNNDITQTNAPLTVRAIVVESDITSTQKTVSREIKGATFG